MLEGKLDAVTLQHTRDVALKAGRGLSEAQLYRHQDCMSWDDPRAYSDYSPMNRQPDRARMGPHAARMEIWK